MSSLNIIPCFSILLFQAQLVLLGILTLAIINFFIGTFLPASDEKKWKGVVGYNGMSLFQLSLIPIKRITKIIYRHRRYRYTLAISKLS